MESRVAPLVGPGTSRIVKLGGDERLITTPIGLERPANDLLTLSLPVAVGGIEQVDARIQRYINHAGGVRLGRGIGKVVGPQDQR